MELREGIKFSTDEGVFELDYYEENDHGYIIWWDKNGNDWDSDGLYTRLKTNYYQLISYPYEVGDYIKIIRYQGGAPEGGIFKIKSLNSMEITYEYDEYPSGTFMADYNSVRPANDYEINNIKKQKEMKETKFKVGDWVKITKSDSNWNSQMDKFDRQIVQITSITSDDTITFENDGTWQWEYKNNHFVKADSPTRLLSPEEQEYLLVGYATVPTDLSTVPPIRTISESFKFDDYSIHFSGTLNQENSSSPTISIIKPKNKKSMFKSDIVSFK
jgi:hypothetical protein